MLQTQSLDWEDCIPCKRNQAGVTMAAYLNATRAISPVLPGASSPPRQGHVPNQGSSGLSTCPWASTIILSEPRTVCRRWAIVSMVQSANASRMVSWISKSVSVSMAAVASSRIRICGEREEKEGANQFLEHSS